MKLSERLRVCYSMVETGARVADVGCDHGFLGIALLLDNRASFVHATDLRPMPLQNAIANAKRFGVHVRMSFHNCNGLHALKAGDVDTVVCAGMGGDTIISILEAAPWVRDGVHLVLLPHASGNDLRKYLATNGFAITKETLCKDADRLYTILSARHTGDKFVPTHGQEFVSTALLQSGSALLGQYLSQLEQSLQRSVEGLRMAKDESRQMRLDYFASALEEIVQWRKQYGNGV